MPAEELAQEEVEEGGEHGHAFWQSPPVDETEEPGQGSDGVSLAEATDELRRAVEVALDSIDLEIDDDVFDE